MKTSDILFVIGCLLAVTVMWFCAGTGDINADQQEAWQEVMGDE